MRRLLLGFEYVEAKTEGTAPSPLPICTVHLAEENCQHGVERLTAAHPVAHVLGLTRCPSAVLQADDRFENITVRAADDDGLSEAMLTGVYSRLAYHKTVFAHAALVDVPGIGGILFIGRSRVGKTTQAQLWMLARQGEIINGDKVFLGLRPDCPGQVLAYGSPWRGNSPYCINRRVPLRAVISLVRREEKFIRLLSPVEALGVYMPAVFMPNWDIRLTEMVLETMDEMFPLVPFFEMSCAPDFSAVEMAERALATL